MTRVEIRRGGKVLLACLAASGLSVLVGSPGASAAESSVESPAAEVTQVAQPDASGELVAGTVDAIEALLLVLVLGAAGFGIRGTFAVRQAKAGRTIILPETDVVVLAGVGGRLDAAQLPEDVISILADDAVALGGAGLVAVAMADESGRIGRLIHGSG